MTHSRSDGKPTRLGWWPEVRDRSGERQPLTRDQIVVAAVKLIDAEGLEGLSMRRLGQELGAGATSLYWHVKDKDQLIDLALDESALDVRLDDDASAPWRDRLAGLAREIRAGLKRHHHFAPLYGSRIPAGPNTLRVMERLLSLLRAGGYDGEKLMLAFAALTNYVIGSAIMDNRVLSGPETEGKSVEELRAMYLAMLGSLPADVFPNLVRLIPEAGPAAIAEDADFEYGLQRMLDGMEADLIHPGGM
jgi:AcrR family transcriptional regulator